MLGLHNFFRIIIILYVSLLALDQVLGMYHLHEATPFSLLYAATPGALTSTLF